MPRFSRSAFTWASMALVMARSAPGAEAEDRYLGLHVEAGIALKIALATGEFRPGHYTRTAGSNDWTRD